MCDLFHTPAAAVADHRGFTCRLEEKRNGMIKEQTRFMDSKTIKSCQQKAY